MRTFKVGICVLVVAAIPFVARAQGGSGSLKITSYPSGAKVVVERDRHRQDDAN